VHRDAVGDDDDDGGDGAPTERRQRDRLTAHTQVASRLGVSRFIDAQPVLYDGLQTVPADVALVAASDLFI